MPGPFGYVAAVVKWFVEHSAYGALDDIRKYEAQLAELDDETLLDECRRIVFGASGRRGIAAEESHAVPLHQAHSHQRAAFAVAAAAEHFARFPLGGLPTGTRLHEGQLKAAHHLVDGCIVQMDTGEGKTFALLAAAFALLAEHPRVYIVTANPYLAARDTAATAPFWKRLEVSVGAGLPDEYEEADARAWSASVVYTTLPALAFRTLQEDMGTDERTLTWSAVLIDEADDVLLEESTGECWITRDVPLPRKDYAEAITIARGLESHHVAVDGESTTRLTLEGEQRVAQTAAGRTADELALLLRDVELAYSACMILERGHDYEIEGQRIVPMRTATGWRNPGAQREWLTVLAQGLGLPTPESTEVVHVVDGLALLRRFEHRAGTSGTIAGDAFAYWLMLALLPATVAPRRPRHDGRLPDTLAATREAAHDEVIKQIVERGPHQPILVITESTVSAATLAEQVRSKVGDAVLVRAVVGETMLDERVFETAGRPGVTLVSTRAAGRGVDIVLTPAARANGGAMLFVLGHASEARLDRQVLGRVGRNGDPFTAQFISSYDDAFFRHAPRFGRLPEDAEPIRNAFFNFAVARHQVDSHLAGLRRFIGGVINSESRTVVYEMLQSWWSELPPGDERALSDQFLRVLARRHVELRYPAIRNPALRTSGGLRSIADELCDMLGSNGEARDRLHVELAGPHDPDKAAVVLREHIVAALIDARRLNDAECERAARAHLRADNAAIDLPLVRFARGMFVCALSRDDVSLNGALDLALATWESDAARRVSPEVLRDRFAEVSGWSGDPIPPAEALERLRDSTMDAHARTALIVRAIASVFSDPSRLDQACGEALAGEAARLEGNLGLVLDLSSTPARIALRGTRGIASQTIANAANGLVTDMERTGFRLRQIERAARYERAFREAIAILTRKTEADLAADLCANLREGERPVIARRAVRGKRGDDLRADAVQRARGREPLGRAAAPTSIRDAARPVVIAGHLDPGVLRTRRSQGRR